MEKKCRLRNCFGALLRANHQKRVYQAVEERGYRRGWDTGQFAARQVLKLGEELSELAAHFFFPRTDFYSANQEFDKTGWLCKKIFDRGERLLGIRGANKEELIKSELADMQVIIFCLAEVLKQMTGEDFSVIDAALEKSQADIKRGVRK